jgi:hypothetical protein
MKKVCASLTMLRQPFYLHAVFRGFSFVYLAKFNREDLRVVWGVHPMAVTFKTWKGSCNRRALSGAASPQ